MPSTISTSISFIFHLLLVTHSLIQVQALPQLQRRFDPPHDPHLNPLHRLKIPNENEQSDLRPLRSIHHPSSISLPSPPGSSVHQPHPLQPEASHQPHPSSTSSSPSSDIEKVIRIIENATSQNAVAPFLGSLHKANELQGDAAVTALAKLRISVRTKYDGLVKSGLITPEDPHPLPPSETSQQSQQSQQLVDEINAKIYSIHQLAGNFRSRFPTSLSRIQNMEDKEKAWYELERLLKRVDERLTALQLANSGSSSHH